MAGFLTEVNFFWLQTLKKPNSADMKPKRWF
ncbi:hypothetical protein CCACVL1_22588 [Corchorus capsularis]|uniref:Uncharacterized protein n=1 Tax=Corchorus capsularis TaxID=210143 RepID=A0A1R3GXZ4_COCAP|nr:hypothetical protein CCACVL1_22588 [Corchorus capsularis]